MDYLFGSQNPALETPMGGLCLLNCSINPVSVNGSTKSTTQAREATHQYRFCGETQDKDWFHQMALAQRQVRIWGDEAGGLGDGCFHGRTCDTRSELAAKTDYGY